MREKNNKVIFKVLFDENDISLPKDNSPLLYSAEDIKQAEIAGYNQGFEEGYIDGLKQGAEKTLSESQIRLQSLTKGLIQKISELADQDTLNMKQSTEKIILLTQSIIKKTLPNLINMHGISEIEATIRRIFSTFLEKQTLLIRLHPEILPTILQNLEDMSERFGKFLNFEHDTNLDLYECNIEWHGGGALWNQASTLQKVEEILMASLDTATAIGRSIEKNEDASEEVNKEINEGSNE
jgi:flagellar biosynthesis/type III secretory pathway protein FliH